MPRLSGKIAWVTGAGSGIGEAAALALADEGATVILTGRTASKLENVARRINQTGGTVCRLPFRTSRSGLPTGYPAKRVRPKNLRICFVVVVRP